MARKSVTTEELRFTQLGKLADAAGMQWHVGVWPAHEPKRGHGARYAKDLAHELGHFLTAPPELRDLPWFGMGHPRTVRPSVTDDPHAVMCVELEVETVVMGSVLLAEVGYVDAAIEEAIAHRIVDHPDDGVRACARMRAKGLIDGDREALWWSIHRAASYAGSLRACGVLLPSDSFTSQGMAERG